MNQIDVHLATIAVKEYREDSAVGGVNLYNTEIMADTLEKFVAQEARLQALREMLAEQQVDVANSIGDKLEEILS